MDTKVYLTTDEQKAFEALPLAFRAGWIVEQEVLDCYETDRQIQMRYFLADFTALPNLADLAKQVMENPSNVSLDDFADLNPEIQREIYFMMGARGVKRLMMQLMKELTEDEDVQALSVLSHVRHKLLQMNSKTCHA